MLRFSDLDYNNLIKHTKNNLKNYEIQLEILNNITFLKKKDGGDFQNIKKSFDIETLEKYLKSKYGYVSLYLSESDYDYSICFTVDNLRGTVYITKRVYVDDISKETAEAKSYKIQTTFTRQYYNNDTVDELKEVVEKQKQFISRYIEREKIAISQLDTLKEIANNFIKECNERLKNEYADFEKLSFYGSDIKELFY